MQFADVEARKVFRAYVFPCLDGMVPRPMSEPEIRELRRGYPLHRLDEDIENKYFSRPAGRCAETAKRMGKDVIDVDAVRQYFFFEHDRYVDTVFCRVWPGVVCNIKEKDEGHAIVATQYWTRSRRTELVKGVQEGNVVTVHRAFISEIVDKETADEITGARATVPCL